LRCERVIVDLHEVVRSAVKVCESDIASRQQLLEVKLGAGECHFRPFSLRYKPINNATAGGTIHPDHIELYCHERPPIHEGQVLMVRSLDPHGE
jgi:hypothetical protein